MLKTGFEIEIPSKLSKILLQFQDITKKISEKKIKMDAQSRLGILIPPKLSEIADPTLLS